MNVDGKHYPSGWYRHPGNGHSKAHYFMDDGPTCLCGDRKASGLPRMVAIQVPAEGMRAKKCQARLIRRLGRAS